MSDNFITTYYNKLSATEVRILRYAFGSSLAMAVALGFNYPLAFLTPVVILGLLAAPGPGLSIKNGLLFIFYVTLAGLIILNICKLLLPYQYIFIPGIFLVLIWIYYGKGGNVPPTLISFLLISIGAIPLVMLKGNAVGDIVAFNLFVNASAIVVVTWISFGLLPYKAEKGKEDAGHGHPPAPAVSKNERFKTALESAIVFYPVILTFLYFELASGLLAIVFMAILSGQPAFAKDFSAGKGLILGNIVGGIFAIILYWILVAVPDYYYMILLVFFCGLFLGSILFSNNPKGPFYGLAYSTMLMVTVQSTGGAAEAEGTVYSRIMLLSIAVIYVVVAFGLLNHFKNLRRKKKMNRVTKKGLSIALLGIVLTSCTMGPNYMAPQLEPVETYRADSELGKSIANIPWWEMFGDSVLQSLITEALENNRDLRVSMARISEAEAVLGIVRSNLYPRVDYSAGGFYDKSFGDESDASGSGDITIGASYQVDLWGRVSRSNEAALQELLSTEEAFRGVTIVLVSEIATSYFLLRDIDNRLMVSEYTAEARRGSLELILAKYDAGIVSEVDVNQAEILLAEAEASVQNYERLRAQTENAISLLLSKPPMQIERGLPLDEQIFSPDIPVGLPSDLLIRRPDLLEAERQLHAQTARIGIAEALKYPQLTLSADLGAQFTSLTNGFIGLGAQILGPIFNAGANQQRVEVEIARTEQLLNIYEQTYYTALREVEDAMVAVNTYEEEYLIRSRQVKSSQNAADLSWVRYEGGLTSYLEVLDVERSLFSAQILSSETYQLQLASVVSLYKALGGGWVPEQDSLLINKTNIEMNEEE